MKIALLEPIGVTEEYLNELACPLKEAGHEFVYYKDKTTDVSELCARSKDCDIVMIANNPYPAQVIESNSSLKMLSVAFTGIDHVATATCKEKGVMICNAAGYSTQTVAELVLGMTIDALRNIVVADGRTRNAGTSAGIGGREIAGKTVGIIGLGSIGLRVAELFLAFGAHVIAYNRSQSDRAVQLGIEYKSLDEVLTESDIISLNLPLNDSTRGFISAECIGKMKKNAIFINCARGPIVDNDALADALNEDRLGFACLDVYDMEPPIPADYKILSAKNTLLTPHQAFISEESMMRRAKIVFDNVEAFLQDAPINVCKL